MDVKKPKDKFEYYDIIENISKTDTLKEISEGEKCKRKANEKELYTFRKLHKELNNKYNLETVAGLGNDLLKAKNIMSWLRKNTYYCGMTYNTPADNGLSILDLSFGKDFDKAINCRFNAIALADCLVSVGLKAYPVALVSQKDEITGEYACHLMTHVFLSEENQWCLFDPSFDVCFRDDDGRYLDVFQLKDLFLKGDTPIAEGYSFNGEDIHKEIYLNYFAKQCLTNITTWHDNSMIGRNYSGMNFAFRKKFNCKIPN